MLRKSPCRTPALLAANRSNASKSTGPRTVRGKARVALNALKHGRYARRLGHRLLRAGDGSGAEVYRHARSAIAWAFVPRTPALYRSLERMASQAWWQLRARMGCGTKPECPVISAGSAARALLTANELEGPGPLRRRFAIADPHRRVGLTFWRQRRRHVSLNRFVEFLRTGRMPQPLRLAQEWESGLRFRIYRLGRPRFEERMRYALDKEGRYRPEFAPQCRAVIKTLRSQGLWPLPPGYVAPFYLDPFLQSGPDGSAGGGS